MTPDVFDNFCRNVSDIHQHNTRNATQNLLYAAFRGATRGQQTFKYCGPHIWNFIIKILIQTVQLVPLKNILVNYFLPLEMISCKLIHNQL